MCTQMGTVIRAGGVAPLSLLVSSAMTLATSSGLGERGHGPRDGPRDGPRAAWAAQPAARAASSRSGGGCPAASRHANETAATRRAMRSPTTNASWSGYRP
ncbi:hypothetical protein GCM10020216_027070 [Nonomuraea helvata]